MKTWCAIILFVIVAFAGAVVSTVVTMIAWNIQIEPRLFQCIDSMGLFDNYWTDMGIHQSAGDTISPGWTWGQLEGIRMIYVTVFWLMWIGSVFFFYKVILPLVRRAGDSLDQESRSISFHS
jgi:hypothetical protein